MKWNEYLLVNYSNQGALNMKRTQQRLKRKAVQ